MAQPTKAEIEEYLADEEKRKEFGREADALEAKGKLFKARLRELVVAEGGKKLRVIYRGFLLGLEYVKGSVAWKSEFIRVAGADEATKVSAAAPPRESLIVERAT